MNWVKQFISNEQHLDLIDGTKLLEFLDSDASGRLLIHHGEDHKCKGGNSIKNKIARYHLQLEIRQLERVPLHEQRLIF